MNIDLLKKKIREANPALTRKFTTRNGHGEKVEDTVVSTREIRLADVLWAIEYYGPSFRQQSIAAIISPFSVESWNFLNDNLDKQSDKCKDFLIKLLV